MGNALDTIKLIVLAVMLSSSTVSSQPRNQSALFLITNADWPAFEATGRFAEDLWSKSLVQSKLLAYSDKVRPGLHDRINVPRQVDPIAFFNKEIQSLVQDKTESSTLFMMTHGWRDDKNPRRPGVKDVRMYVQKDRGLYFSNLATDIERWKPKEKALRYYSSVCYGNGAHLIAFKNENTCGLGFGDYEIFFPNGYIATKEKKTELPKDWLTTARERNHIPIIENIASGKKWDLDGSGVINLLDQYLALTMLSDGRFTHTDKPVGMTPHLLPWTVSLSSMGYSQLILGKKDFFSAFKFEHSKSVTSLPDRISRLRKNLRSKKHLGSNIESWSQIRYVIHVLFDFENDVHVQSAISELPLSHQKAFAALLKKSSAELAWWQKKFADKYSNIRESTNQVTEHLQRAATCSAPNSRCHPVEYLRPADELLQNIVKDFSEILAPDVFFQNRGRMLDRYILLGYGLKKANAQQREKLLQLMDCEQRPL